MSPTPYHAECVIFYCADQLTCVDRSYSRLQRLKEVMRLYVPHSYISEGKVQCLHDNGIEFSKKTVADKNLYDRVSHIKY
jgi:hypothetical protein